MRRAASSTPAPNAKAADGTSTIAARPSCHVTTAMSASDAAFTPSSAAPAIRDLRSRGIIGPLIATKMNAGRKIPIVATIAPGTPAST